MTNFSGTLDLTGLLQPDNIAVAFMNTSISDNTSIGSVGQAFASTIYAGRVYLDTEGDSGSDYGNGTFNYPCNNISDGIDIANKFNCNNLHLHSNMTLYPGSNVTAYILDGHSNSTLTISAGSLVDDGIFKGLTITGIMNGTGMVYSDCKLLNCENMTGIFKNGSVGGNIYLLDERTNWFTLTNVTGDSTNPVHFYIGQANLNISNFQGYIDIRNQNHPDSQANINIEAGVIIIDPSCTAGRINIFGQGEVINNSGGSIVNTDNILTKESIGDQVWKRTSGLQRLIESQKNLPMYGEFFYVDYTNGNNTNDGLTPETPVASVQWAHDNLVTAGKGDMIFLLDDTGIDIDEQWVFTKNHFAVRGSGWSTTLYPSAPSGASITINAAEVELSNFQVRCASTTLSTGDQTCINLINGADLCVLKNLKIKRSFNGGVNINESAGVLIKDCIIEHHLGTSCIHLRNNSHECVFENNFIYDAMNAIEVHDTAYDNWIKKNLFHDMETGIMIMDSTVGHLYIDRDIIFGNIDTHVNNNIGGTGIIYFRQEETDNIITNTANATWNEQLSQHQAVGSAGYSLGNVSAGSNPSDIANAVWDHADATSIQNKIDFIKQIEGGRWSVIGTQMVFYMDDNTTEIARFNLIDEYGNPNAEAVFHRYRA